MNTDRRLVSSYAPQANLRQRIWVVIVVAALAAASMLAVSAARPHGVLAADPVTITFTVESRPYDGTTEATITGCDIEEPTVGDVSCDASGATATFDTKDVGVAIPVSGGSFALAGADAGNYVIGNVDDSSADITSVHLTASIAAEDKVYDGNTDAAYACILDEGVIDGEDVTCDGDPASFDSKDVGTRTATASNLELSGAGSGNYELDADSDTDDADITVKHLTATITAANRVYDGTTDANYTCALIGVIGTEDVTCDGTHPATFSSRNVGTRTATASGLVLGGSAIDNYFLDNTSAANGADISQAPLTITAVLNAKEADGGVTAAATPSVSGTIYTASGDAAAFVETYDTPATGVAKTLTPSGIVNDGNLGLNYSYNFVSQPTGRIWPAPVATLSFITQPVDTKTNTAIYSFCVPTGTAIPCALTTATGGEGPSTPIKVEARDQYLNLAGPGAPGDDGEADDIPVNIEDNNNLGPSLGSVDTTGGVATFADNLKIAPVGPPKTKLRASTTSGSASPTTSDAFMIVNDLKACDGTFCDNSTNNNPTGAPTNKLQKAAGQINTTLDFFVTGTTNVVLSTQFVAGTETNQLACGNNGPNSPLATIGDATDLAVNGLNVGGTAPSTEMVLIMPKDTLKTYNISARGAETFDLCLGAKKVATGPNFWKGKSPNKKVKGLVQSLPGTDLESRQWGIPANCGTAGLLASDPCIGLRTKQAATARSYLTSAAIGWTPAQVDALGIKDSDLVIVLIKRPPWDGKTGIKPS